MSKRGRGLSELASYLLKILFVMIFPLTFYIVEAVQILLPQSSGMLFPAITIYPEYIYDFSFIMSLVGSYFSNFIVGLIIAFPGIYYNYKLSRAPLNRSYWKRGVGFSAIIFFITLGFVTFLMQFAYSPIYGMNDSISYLTTKLAFYPSLVMAVFVILPLGLRQAVIISVPSDLHYYSMHDIEASTKFNIIREKMLSAIFWIFICFAPYLFQDNSYSWYGGYISNSFMMDYIFDSNWYGPTDAFSFYFRGNIAAFPVLPFFALLVLPNFLFAKDVYRYLRKTITRRRLISMAVFSCCFPLILVLGLYGFLTMLAGPYMFMPALPIPLPLIQIAGLLIVRYHRPQAVQTERVWKGDRSAMWWEGAPEGIEPPVPKPIIQTTPEKPNRHREEQIKVPIRYRILSRVRFQRSKSPSQSEV